MILNIDTTKHIDGNVPIKQFQVSVDAKTFSLLTNKLYVDPVAATSRELLSNAVDAARMKTPAVEISVLSVEGLNAGSRALMSAIRDKNPDRTHNVIIRDFGPGIPHDKFDDVYNNFFSSTKDKDASAIGGFGLGSKSPFSVAQSFEVRNHYNGLTSHYVYAIQDGIPSFVNLGSVPSFEQPSGLEVIIPVTTKQSVQFLQELKLRTWMFKDIEFILHGFDDVTSALHNSPIVFESPQIISLEHMRSPVASINGVVYFDHATLISLFARDSSLDVRKDTTSNPLMHFYDAFINADERCRNSVIILDDFTNNINFIPSRDTFSINQQAHSRIIESVCNDLIKSVFRDIGGDPKTFLLTKNCKRRHRLVINYLLANPEKRDLILAYWGVKREPYDEIFKAVDSRSNRLIRTIRGEYFTEIFIDGVHYSTHKFSYYSHLPLIYGQPKLKLISQSQRNQLRGGMKEIKFEPDDEVVVCAFSDVNFKVHNAFYRLRNIFSDVNIDLMKALGMWLTFDADVTSKSGGYYYDKLGSLNPTVSEHRVGTVHLSGMGSAFVKLVMSKKAKVAREQRAKNTERYRDPLGFTTIVYSERRYPKYQSRRGTLSLELERIDRFIFEASDMRIRTLDDVLIFRSEDVGYLDPILVGFKELGVLEQTMFFTDSGLDRMKNLKFRSGKTVSQVMEESYAKVSNMFGMVDDMSLFSLLFSANIKVWNAKKYPIVNLLNYLEGSIDTATKSKLVESNVDYQNLITYSLVGLFSNQIIDHDSPNPFVANAFNSIIGRLNIVIEKLMEYCESDPKITQAISQIIMYNDDVLRVKVSKMLFAKAKQLFKEIKC